MRMARNGGHPNVAKLINDLFDAKDAALSGGSGSASGSVPPQQSVKACAAIKDVTKIKEYVDTLAREGKLDEKPTTGETAFAAAIAAGNGAMVTALIVAGADLDLVDNNGLTPLMAAVAKGDAAIIAQLMEAGANTTGIDKDGNGVTSVMEIYPPRFNYGSHFPSGRRLS